MKKISIIIPCYNEEETIGLIIDRILEVDKFSYEIIVIDDFSTDKISLYSGYCS